MAVPDETPVLDLLGRMTEASVEASSLDPQALMLVRIAALVAVDAPAVSYLMNIGAASEINVDADQVRGVLAAVAPGHEARYPAGYPRRPTRRRQPFMSRFPLPFGRRRSLLGHSGPRRGVGPPHGRLTGPESARTPAGLPRCAHMSGPTLICAARASIAPGVTRRWRRATPLPVRLPSG
jgi:hypothetical protein